MFSDSSCKELELEAMCKLSACRLASRCLQAQHAAAATHLTISCISVLVASCVAHTYTLAALPQQHTACAAMLDKLRVCNTSLQVERGAPPVGPVHQPQP